MSIQQLRRASAPYPRVLIHDATDAPDRSDSHGAPTRTRYSAQAQPKHPQDT